jgi:hypothetical protein
MRITDFRAVYMPYCIEKQKDGRYVVLNRDYKPVGMATESYVHYDDFPVAVQLKGLTARIAKKVSFGDGAGISGDRIYLYDDSCIPTRSAENMSDYMRRLAILAKLTVTQIDEKGPTALEWRPTA